MTAQKIPVSCFIITKNEADRLPRTLASIEGLMAEIVVVDSGSSDDTLAIADAAGAKTMFNAWPGFGQQKRFAEQQCSNDWLFNLDADEVIGPGLAAELRALFKDGEPPLAAYGMRDSIVYPGNSVPRPLARDHFFYRLYDKRRVRFANSTLYDNVDVSDVETGRLNGALHHFAARSFSDLAAKCDERAHYNAAHSKPKSRPELALRLLTEWPVNFFKYYLFRTHILGGLKGLRYAAIVSHYRWLRIVRMWRGAGDGTGEKLNER
jgi:glycosyltransferase involved in cell wall biosynthesis